jgi:CheY-like chemotaxis protein
MDGGMPIPGRRPPAGGVPGGALHVLVVDDCPDNAASMAMLVRFWGHAAEVAQSGREALHKAQSRLPDVMLLDIGMPGMNGYQVAREFRRMFGGGPLLVAVSVYGFDEDVRHGREAGFDRHLVKPVPPQRVGEILREAAAAAAYG